MYFEMQRECAFKLDVFLKPVIIIKRVRGNLHLCFCALAYVNDYKTLEI